jgi:hypothetical protein
VLMPSHSQQSFKFLVNDVYQLLLAVLKVSIKESNGSESSVTVRLYGPNTDLVIDRKRELQVST